LHSGNHEIIGIRHRGTQTLHISNLIVPHNCVPSYGKIHVGLYIAAIRDAVDRVKQDIKAMEENKNAQRDGALKDGEDHGSDRDLDEHDQPGSSRKERHRKDPSTKDTKKKGRTQPTGNRNGSRGGTSARKHTTITDPVCSPVIHFIPSDKTFLGRTRSSPKCCFYAFLLWNIFISLPCDLCPHGYYPTPLSWTGPILST
jgi:hypothetical protein